MDVWTPPFLSAFPPPPTAFDDAPPPPPQCNPHQRRVRRRRVPPRSADLDRVVSDAFSQMWGETQKDIEAEIAGLRAFQDTVNVALPETPVQQPIDFPSARRRGSSLLRHGGMVFFPGLTCVLSLFSFFASQACQRTVRIPRSGCGKWIQ